MWLKQPILAPLGGPQMRVRWRGRRGEQMTLHDHHALLVGSIVRLEPLTVEHAAALWQAAQRVGESGRLTLIPVDEESTKAYIGEALAAKAQGRALPYAIVSLADGRVVGSTRFGNIERWQMPANSPPRNNVADVVEIGWTWFERDAQRTGMNTEAKLLLLTHAFEVLHVERVTLKTDVRNERSRAAISRIGATFEGILRRHLPATDGGARDTAMYSIIASEWPHVERMLRARLDQKKDASS